MIRSRHGRRIVLGLPLLSVLFWLGSLPFQKGWTQDGLCFINVSDLHYTSTVAEHNGTSSPSMGPVFRALVDEINQLKGLDFVVLTGDLCADPSPADFEEIRNILDRLRVPCYVIPGNHDIPDPGSGNESSGGPSFARIFHGHGPHGDQTFWEADPRPGWHIVGLDSTVPGTWEGEISQRQLRWIEEDLKKHAGKATILLSHHGLIAHHPWDEEVASQGYVARNAGEVRALLERFPSVDLVITGHHHFSAYRNEKGIAYVSCPSLASWPCRYSRFEIRGGRLEFSTHPIPSRAFEERARQNLLASRSLRDRFPPGKKGEEEMLRLFLGLERISIQLPFLAPGAQAR